MGKDSSIIFNFFESDCTSELCQHFSIDPQKLDATLKRYDVDDIFDIIDELEINLETPIDNVQVIWYHLTTTVDGEITSFHQHGFLPLRDMLTKDTALHHFLSSHHIYFDLTQQRMIFDNHQIKLCAAKDYLMANELERAIDDLYTRIYEHDGEIEGFLRTSNILSYSCICHCPEILMRIDNILNSISYANQRDSLQSDWANEPSHSMHLLKVITPLSHTRLDEEGFLEDIQSKNQSKHLSQNYLPNLHLLSMFLFRWYTDEKAIACIIDLNYRIPSEAITELPLPLDCNPM